MLLNEIKSRNKPAKEENRDANKLFQEVDYNQVGNAENWKIKPGDSAAVQMIKNVII
jgi:hypothetical protein